MYECSHCKSKFEKLGLIHGIAYCCPNCGDNRYIIEIKPVIKEEFKLVIPEPIIKPVIDLDLDKDGDVDKKDSSIAGRFLKGFSRRGKVKR